MFKRNFNLLNSVLGFGITPFLALGSDNKCIALHGCGLPCQENNSYYLIFGGLLLLLYISAIYGTANQSISWDTLIFDTKKERNVHTKNKQLFREWRNTFVTNLIVIFNYFTKLNVLISRKIEFFSERQILLILVVFARFLNVNFSQQKRLFVKVLLRVFNMSHIIHIAIKIAKNIKNSTAKMFFNLLINTNLRGKVLKNLRFSTSMLKQKTDKCQFYFNVFVATKNKNQAVLDFCYLRDFNIFKILAGVSLIFKRFSLYGDFTPFCEQTRLLKILKSLTVAKINRDLIFVILCKIGFSQISINQ